MKALIVNNVSKNFGGLQALLQVKLELEVGERRVIIGPNGAGKTTLLHIIGGILKPSAGEIKLFDKNITFLPIHSRANLEISQTFQSISLFTDLSVLENALLALRSYKLLKYSLFWPLRRYKHIIEEGEHLLREWGLWEKRDYKVSSLSHGEQRLLDIILAFGSRPRLILMDEPTSGLTLSEAKVIVSRINKLSRKHTILFIEHKMDFALELADKVTVLNFGRVISEGTPAQIKNDPLVKRVYLGT